jgi:hypothetical protein
MADRAHDLCARFVAPSASGRRNRKIEERPMSGWSAGGIVFGDLVAVGLAPIVAWAIGIVSPDFYKKCSGGCGLSAASRRGV